MISYSLFYFSFFCLIFSSIHIFFFFFHFSFFFCSCFSPPHTYTHSPLYLQLFHFCFCFSTSLHNTQQLSLFLSLLSLSSLLFLLFYFLYSWQYIVNFSPHTSCIILQLHRPSQTKVHNMKNLIWERERERERAGGEQKPYGSLSFLSFFFSFFSFFSDFIWFMRKFDFVFGLRSAFCSHWDKEEREWGRKRNGGKRKKSFFIQPGDYFKG